MPARRGTQPTRQRGASALTTHFTAATSARAPSRQRNRENRKSMVERIYVEKQPQFAQEAASALADIRNVLGFSGVKGLRIINRYDVEGVSKSLFSSCRNTVF